MIKSETYQGIAGLNYIQDSELAFATIYVVKREGEHYDKYIAGTTNRKYIYTESSGKISFVNVFSPGGEKVFVLYKVGSGAEPEIPPGVCIPVAITPITLPSAVVDEFYSQTIYLTGTGPFIVTPIVVPVGMNLTNSGSTISFYGTMTTVQTESLQFSVSNCSGGSSVPFSQSFEVLPADFTLFIANLSTAGVTINSLVPLSYTVLTGSFPVPYLAYGVNGVHAAFSGKLTVNITGLVFPFNLRLIKNGIEIQVMLAVLDGDYQFDPETFLSTDEIQILLN